MFLLLLRGLIKVMKSTFILHSYLYNMRLPIYIVHAFTNKLFEGNPAAVCPLTDWLPDDVMQKLAKENNLSETAFFVPEEDGFRIRWFTPTTEVKLCGHATLASAHILFTELGYEKDEILFYSLSGVLKINRAAEKSIQLDFPANQPIPLTDVPEALFSSLHVQPAPVFTTSFDMMVVLPSQKDIEELKPDFATLATVKARGVICTAKGDDSDIVARCFYPQSGINEDPVTGSAHTILVPYWAEKLGKNKLQSIQLSARKGYLDCELKGDRVLMRGNAKTYLKGTFFTE